MKMTITRKWIAEMPRELRRSAARCTTMERPSRRALLSLFSEAQRELLEHAAKSDDLRSDLQAIIGSEREVSVTFAAQQLRRRGWHAVSHAGRVEAMAACAGFIVRRYFDAAHFLVLTTIGVKGEDEFLAD